jgi:outer membrane protein TolC
MVSIGVSIPLQWDQKDRQNRELASKLALAERAKAEHEEALRAHIGEVRTMIAEWENGRDRLARYESEVVPLARERTKAALAAYQGGRANLSELLLARRNEIEARMQAVQVESDIARLWGQLNFLFPEGAGATHAGVPAQASAERGKEPR